MRELCTKSKLWGLGVGIGLLLTGGLYATFDEDENDLSDVFEWKYPEVAGDPQGDFDGDGISNVDEALAGTDPTDPVSKLGADSSFDVNVENVAFSWFGVRGKRYEPQRSSDLLNWEAVQPVILGTEDYLVENYPIPLDQYSFFRIQVLGALDTDGDGLDDWEEFLFGSDPNRVDQDGDGLVDSQEFSQGKLFNYPDSDGSFYYVDNLNGDDSYDGFSAFPRNGSRGPKASIQNTLETALSGSTILIQPGTGTYFESLLTTLGKSLTLKATGSVRITRNQ